MRNPLFQWLFTAGAAAFAALLLMCSPAHAKSAPADEREVAAVVQDYLDGTSFNRPDKLRRALHPDARLHLRAAHGGVREVRAAQYIKSVASEPGKFKGQSARLLSVQLAGETATAKAEVHNERLQQRAVNLFLLGKVAGAWKILSKTASSESAAVRGQQVLLALSSVHTMPGTDFNSGNSFGELIHAYYGFRAAGYGVQFVSPQGGGVPLAYIDFTDAEHRDTFYDPDLMWALANTRKPQQLAAEDYVALMYIGGSAAMYGVAEDRDMQKLAMSIYEQRQGVIAAVCHGSAGLVDLKLADGTPIVAGKRVTAYPDAFENMKAAYYKTFPFSIEQRLKQSEGIFTAAARGQSHVEADDRLITGMNWESTRGVVAAVVTRLQTQTFASDLAGNSSSAGSAARVQSPKRASTSQ
jgi:putative intracellular protease/amidase